MEKRLVTNQKGEIVTFCITQGNVDDCVPMKKLFHGLKGLGAEDKGYLSKDKMAELEKSGLTFEKSSSISK